MWEVILLTKRAYSLLELVVVVAIIMIILSISMNSISSVAGLDEKMEVKKIRNYIISARDMARTNSSPSKVCFSEDNIKIELESGYKFEKKFVHLRYDDVNSNRYIIKFTRRGIPSYEGACSLFFKGRRKSYKIVVLPVSGRVEIR